jgi:Ca2+-dependent lipid-binding protein
MTGHLIKFGIYRCEHLAPLDLIANSVDAYVKISFAGTSATTKVIKSDRNPEFN